MKIFLAAPFTGKIDPVTKQIEQSFRKWLEDIFLHLQSQGHQVASSHVRENWGIAIQPPKIALYNDFDSVKSCDLLIAYPGNPPSPGVHMELGFAGAIEKPIILIQEAGSRLPYLVNGLGELTSVREINFNDLDDLFSQLDQELSRNA